MFEQLWEGSPRVQKVFADGIAEGEVKGELKEARAAVVMVVKARFPALTELALRCVAAIDKPDALNLLLVQISVALNEEAARHVLQSSIVLS